MFIDDFLGDAFADRKMQRTGKVKILIVIPYFMPAIGYGGPVRVAYDTANALTLRGHEVTVATTDVFDGQKRVEVSEERLDGIMVKRFRNISNRLAKKMNGYLPVAFIPWIIRNAKKYDVIYCHDFFSVQTLTAGLVSKYCKVPLVIQPHGSLSEVRRDARFSFIKGFLVWLFGGVLKSAEHIIALTEDEKSSIAPLLRGHVEKIAVIPNGLNPDNYLNIAPIDIHQKYGIPAQHIIIGFIGRLAYIKGLDISLKVLARLKNSYQFSFIVIGPDEGEETKLKKLADELELADRVVFTGVLDGMEKLQVVRSCRFFLFTSRDEGLPMTILEVAALGVPQVISRECHVPEVAEFRAGYVHGCDDLDNLAKSVEKILTNHPETVSMSRQAQRMVREKFSSDRVIDAVEAVLR